MIPKLKKRFKFYLHRLSIIPAHFIIIALLGFSLFALIFNHLSVQVSTNQLTINQLTLPTSTPVPPGPQSYNQPLPKITAEYYFVIDQASKVVLSQKDADLSVPPASTTKIMTALVAMDKYKLNQVINVDKSYTDGQVVGFQIGEQLTVEQLLYSLLVHSANDAAEILAENYPGGRTVFIDDMNAKAAQLGLSHTQFKNPSGLDEDGHYSSASDLARLAGVAMDNPEFARIVGTENTVISNHVLTNVNQLLGKVPGVLGIKTGYTDNAGQALVTLVSRDNHPVILVVLKSTDRFSDTEK